MCTPLTFTPSFTIRAPCYELIYYLSLAVDDEHRYSRVREVRDAFISDDGDKLCMRVTLCKHTYVFERSLAAGDAAPGS